MPLSAAYTLVFTIFAAILLLNAIDDLAPSFICLAHLLRKCFGPAGPFSRQFSGDAFRMETLRPRAPNVTDISGNERRIAIFVPCWKEAAVIGNMVRHNLAAIRYSKFDFFLGVYPNDAETLSSVHELARLYRNVHAAPVPHDGPTSKADCLNWTCQALWDYEEASGILFDTVVVHDAEDLIHPDALRAIHVKRFEYDMVQVPVLPLPTGITELTHGIYCDEFAEFQAIDMRARLYSKSFLPSNGVGTGYSRVMLDRLAEVRSNRVFEPVALTEDYESGVRIHQLGFKQTFARLRPDGAGRDSSHLIATREYFPRSFRAAVRQRTRWVTGIGLQGWERIGWNGTSIDRYWFWRDRKTLFTNPLGMAIAVLMPIAVADLALTAALGHPWHFALTSALAVRLCWANVAVQSVRSLIRMVSVARIFGFGFALAVPVRAFYASLINGYATLNAWHSYLGARMTGRPLVWLKTEHTYPNRASLSSNWKTVEEVLTGSGYLSHEMLAMAQRTLPQGSELGAHLIENGWISEDGWWEVLSLATGVDMPYRQIEPETVSGRASRFLPRRIQRAQKVLPVAVRNGNLVIATAAPPTEETRERLQRFTGLRLEFQLVTPANLVALNRHMNQWRAEPVRQRQVAQFNQPAAVVKAAAASAR